MRFLLLAGLLALAVPVPTAAAPVEPTPAAGVVGDGVIVPGQRVGPARLGMTVDQIIAAIGPVFKRDEFPTEKIILYEWRTESVWVSLDRATKALRVISVFGTNSKYRTDKGLRLLDPLAKAEQIYGKKYTRWEYRREKIILVRYAERGLQLGIVDDPGKPLVHGRIFQIGIFKPGELAPVRTP